METTLSSKGQVTIPKHIRDSLKLEPGCKLVLDVNDNLDLILRKSRLTAKPEPRPDRFDRAAGASEIKWDGTVDEYMEFIRGYSDDPA